MKKEFPQDRMPENVWKYFIPGSLGKDGSESAHGAAENGWKEEKRLHGGRFV
ncbi:hypothetical protein [Angelakisella massiliensis]|uniref:hypothetical protein n=1 Tax=Angelakisella massiliensis TaxID=1871018 RepID=UPI0024B1504A|nr:hypothetical protein [Angelakisella massiliensis]